MSQLALYLIAASALFVQTQAFRVYHCNNERTWNQAHSSLSGSKSALFLEKGNNADEIGLQEKNVFIFGLGYVGLRLARFLQSQGWTVSGTCTNVNKALECRKEGIQTYLFDEVSVKRGQLEGLQDLLASSCVVSTIPPLDGGKDLVLEAHANDLRRAVLAGNLKWISYLSSTGVYGDCKGAWVSEDEPVKPDSPKTKARADAESRWSSLYSRGGLPVHIFRLAGIYGPDRSAADSLIKAREEMASTAVDDVTFISRIHVDDIVQALCASINTPTPGEIYNVADDLPSTRFDVMSYASRLLSFPPVKPARDSSPSDGGFGSRGGSKRVDNSKLLRLLQNNQMALLYPDYRSGLKTIVDRIMKDENYRLSAASPSGGTRLSSTGAPSSSVYDASYSSSSSETSLEKRVSEMEERLKGLEERLGKSEVVQKSILATLMEINQSIKMQASQKSP